jgi:hypothetical protein
VNNILNIDFIKIILMAMQELIKHEKQKIQERELIIEEELRIPSQKRFIEEYERCQKMFELKPKIAVSVPKRSSFE